MDGELVQRNSSLHSSVLLGQQMVDVKTLAAIANQRYYLCVCVRVCVCVYTFSERCRSALALSRRQQHP